MVRSPVEICLGTSPSQAAKSRPLVNTSPAPIAATIALEIIGPMPGTLINRSQPASWRAMASISFDKPSTRSSSRRQSRARSSIMRNMPGDRTSGGVARIRGKAGLDLATRPLLTQHNRATLIVAHDVERVLADIDTNHGNCSVLCLGHGVLLVLTPLPSFYCWRGGSTAGPSH